tara:strand:+ start:99 stop:512 length:414 start_codon:yes stop_codon:yes gene_type:complete
LNDNISDKDKKDWDTFLQSDEKLEDKDFKEVKKVNINLNLLDLHGYSLESANKEVEKFIEKSFAEGFNKLKIITGKGLHSENEKNPYVSNDLSILKNSVPEFIKNNKNLTTKIIDIKEASNNDGGSGAFYIYLKKHK